MLLKNMVGPCGLEPQTSTVLIVGSSSGGTANPPECASGAKRSLAPSSSIQIWKTLGRQVMACACRLMRLEIASVNKL